MPHGAAPLHTPTHHAQSHILSTRLSIWCFHAKLCAWPGAPPHIGLRHSLSQALEEQLRFNLLRGASFGRHGRYHGHQQTFPSGQACKYTGQHAKGLDKVLQSTSTAFSQLPDAGCVCSVIPNFLQYALGDCGGNHSTIYGTQEAFPGEPWLMQASLAYLAQSPWPQHGCLPAPLHLVVSETVPQ